MVTGGRQTDTLLPYGLRTCGQLGRAPDTGPFFFAKSIDGTWSSSRGSLTNEFGKLGAYSRLGLADQFDIGVVGPLSEASQQLATWFRGPSCSLPRRNLLP